MYRHYSWLLSYSIELYKTILIVQVIIIIFKDLTLLSKQLIFLNINILWVKLLSKFISVCVCVISHVWLFVTLWTTAQQAPLPMKSTRQEDWSGLPFPPPRDLPNRPRHWTISLLSYALAGGFFTPSTTKGYLKIHKGIQNWFYFSNI